MHFQLFTCIKSWQPRPGKQQDQLSVDIRSWNVYNFFLLECVFTWVDLSSETKSPCNLKQSRRVLFAIGLTYVLSFVVSYWITKQVIWWFILGLIYTLVVIILLQQGCLKISEALRATAPVGKRRAMEGFVNVDVKSKETLNSQPKKNLILERRLCLKRTPKSCAKNRNRAGRPMTCELEVSAQTLEFRSMTQIRRVQKYAKLLSIFLAFYFFSSITFVTTLFFPQVGAFTCTCAFTMIWSLLVVRIVVLDFLIGPKKSTISPIILAAPNGLALQFSRS